MHVNNISWLYYRIICKGQWLYKVIYGQEMDVKDLSFLLFLISLYWLSHVAIGILVSQPEIESRPLAGKAQNPNH